MANIKIAVVNACKTIPEQDIERAAPDLEAQVKRDFAPVWGIDADLIFVPKGVEPPRETWWLAILDDADQADALGYHDVTSEGLPLGKVFTKADAAAHASWTVTASHEILEMLVDPEINLSVFVQENARQGTLFAYEVCDACEDDQFKYKSGATDVSDFVFPSWFESFRGAGTQFDYRKKIAKPFELLAGGYIGFFDVASGSGWQQQTAQQGPFSRSTRPRVGSRRERRRLPRDQWRKSERMR